MQSDPNRRPALASDYYSATPLVFPHWQRQYEALVSETDDKRLPERITALETVIFARLQELARDRYTTTERAAIQAAITTLRTIQEGKLGFPKWASVA